VKTQALLASWGLAIDFLFVVVVVNLLQEQIFFHFLASERWRLLAIL